MNQSFIGVFEDCPEFLQSNPYIINGYRINFTYSQCLKSICMYTNESINIWSHLLGVALFIYYLYETIFYILPIYKTSTSTDYLIVVLYSICFIFCFLFSTLFHIFCCHSKKSCDFWLKLDLLGITLSLWGCYIPSIYYGFYCFRLWKIFYTSSIILMMIMNAIFQLHNSRVYTKKTDYKQIVFFVLLVAFGVIPAIHWIYLLNGFSNSLVTLFLPKIVMMYLLGVIAFLFYITKIPEKLFPGYFDYFGASHQCWHLLVIYAFHHWYSTGLLFLDIRLGQENSCRLDFGLETKLWTIFLQTVMLKEIIVRSHIKNCFSFLLYICSYLRGSPEIRWYNTRTWPLFSFVSVNMFC